MKTKAGHNKVKPRMSICCCQQILESHQWEAGRSKEQSCTWGLTSLGERHWEEDIYEAESPLEAWSKARAPILNRDTETGNQGAGVYHGRVSPSGAGSFCLLIHPSAQLLQTPSHAQVATCWRGS